MQKLVETAWFTYRDAVIPKDAPQVQREECRTAFYAGATAVFQGMLRMLDPGVEPTDADLAKMDALDAELKEFAESARALAEAPESRH